MKRVITLIATLFCASLIFAQGIEFFEGSFEEALKAAKKEKKLVFVDAFTTWCGPCKMMSKNVFTDEAVGEYYNENFINLKLDQEKGEGLDFAETYDVRFYPTLVFVNADGNMEYKSIGAMEPTDFIELGTKANTKEHQLLWLEKQFYKDKLTPELYSNYAYSLQSARHWFHEGTVQNYLETQDNWKEFQNVQFIFDHFPSDLESEMFDFIIQEKELFNVVIQDPAYLDHKIYETVSNHLWEVDNLTNERTDEVFKSYYPQTWKQQAEKFKITSLQKNPDTKNSAEFISRKIAYLNEYGSDSWQELNSIAWATYELSNDEEQLGAARALAKQSIEIDENFYNTDTYTWLSVKIGDLESASKYAVKAMKLGKEMDADVSELQEFLDSLSK